MSEMSSLDPLSPVSAAAYGRYGSLEKDGSSDDISDISDEDYEQPDDVEASDAEEPMDDADARWHEPLYEGASISKAEHFLTLQALASRFQLSDRAVEAVGRNILACAPESVQTSRDFCVSPYRLRQFGDGTSIFGTASKVYYCSDCWTKDDTWKQRAACVQHGSCSSYFLQLDIETELQHIFQGALLPMYRLHNSAAEQVFFKKTP